MDFKINYPHESLDTILLNYIKIIYERYKIAQNLKFAKSVKYKELIKEYNVLISFHINRNIIELYKYKIENNDDIIKANKLNTKKTKVSNNQMIKSIKQTIKKTKFNDKIINLDRHNVYSFNYRQKSKEYIGLSNLNEFNIFKSNYIKSFKNIYFKLQKYTINYKKTYNELPYIHLANSYIDLSKFEPRYGNIIEESSACYNPKGLWFSCGISWLTDFVKSNSKFNNMVKLLSSHDNKNKGWIDLPHQVWVPRLIYRLDISKLKIINISNCNEMQLFEKKYYNKNMNTVEEYLNWKKIYKDYDGMIICPYLKDNCFNNNIGLTDLDDLLKLILKGNKIEKHDFTGFWTTCFEAPSGVIWKNYNNLSLHLIN